MCEGIIIARCNYARYGVRTLSRELGLFIPGENAALGLGRLKRMPLASSAACCIACCNSCCVVRYNTACCYACCVVCCCIACWAVLCVAVLRAA